MAYTPRTRAMDLAEQLGIDADRVIDLKEETGFTWEQMAAQFAKQIKAAKRHESGLGPNLDIDEDLPEEFTWYHIGD